MLSFHHFKHTLLNLTFPSLPNIPDQFYNASQSLSSIVKYSVVQFMPSNSYRIQRCTPTSTQASQEKEDNVCFPPSPPPIFFLAFTFLHFLPHSLVPPDQVRQRKGDKWPVCLVPWDFTRWPGCRTICSPRVIIDSISRSQRRPGWMVLFRSSQGGGPKLQQAKRLFLPPAWCPGVGDTL